LQAYFLELLPAGEAKLVAAHIGGCSHCREAYNRLQRAVAPLRDMPVQPVAAESRRRQIALALDAAPQASQRALAWRYGLALGLAAAAMVIVAFFLVPPTSERVGVYVASGTLQGDGKVLTTGEAVALGRELQATSGAVLVLSDGSRVQAERDCRFSVTHERGWRWRVERGTLDIEAAKHKPDEALTVITAEVVVRVVGTQFSVTRREGEGGHAQTTVSVREGSVVAVDPSRNERVLQAGESAVWPIEVAPPKAPVEKAGPAVTPAAGLKSHAPKVAPPSRNRDSGLTHIGVTQEIRDKIRRGDTRSARRLIDQTRANHAGGSSLLAELAVLEAEADLAEGKNAKAVERYLDTTLEFPTAPQAEAALFAAAELAAERPGTGYDAKLLLRDYLARYPTGQFVREAKSLLTTLESRER
jgi:hypothetical protein